MDKKELRKLCIAERNNMNQEESERLSAMISENVRNSSLFSDAVYIYAYYPLGKEADLRPAIEAAWKEGKHVAFPKVFGEDMKFFEVKDFSMLKEGNFHVMEPEDGEEVSWENALVLVPGVAFDRKGNRMGFGKGYYDRYLSSGHYVTMGIAYGYQIKENLPVEEHDHKLMYMVTEEGVWSCYDQREDL